ncbi:MAG TPA: penicillin-binding transpeptidase domain-containing protein [Candidatus Acidoferrum sp.]|nr:penicillin-binding transpeptidase domain-containing protein [Candidatus Acidoferrum sp.]
MATPPRTLFSQSARQVLEREFSVSSVSYLLLDANSGVLLASRWEDSGKPIPLGSLVKPFTALAYAGAHDFRYPIYVCRGQASGCWQVHPHGKLDIVSAISVSCNSYFRSLAESVTSEQLLPVTRTFDLESPEVNFTGPSLIGLGEQWKISPVRMARAYLELYRRRDQPGVREILAGMLRSAQHGTGAAVGRALKHSEAFVKTGTAPCIHAPHAPGDGFVVALVPAQAPEIVLMVRVHGIAGAKAAETAGRMLSRMEE